MEVLARYGSQAQKDKWLKPILEGKARSSFAMTEPGVASSDATNICTTIQSKGDKIVINGKKWWISGERRVHQLFCKLPPSADVAFIWQARATRATRCTS